MVHVEGRPRLTRITVGGVCGLASSFASSLAAERSRGRVRVNERVRALL
jgi:hypothetical protein